MSVLVTGATGFIGELLCKELVARGEVVHALYRSEEKIQFLKSISVKLFKGEVSDKQSLTVAMQGCSQVYHVAAFAKVWGKDKNIAWNINVIGTQNVIEVAKTCGVKRIVFTSTAGVYGASVDNNLVDETVTRSTINYGDYERSKVAAEDFIRKSCSPELEIVIVNPTRVFGPGQLSESNSVTKMIASYIAGKWRVIPGNGLSRGNYVYVNDVVNGHILAMQYGKSGENYILGGENVSYIEFFNTISKVSGKKYRLFFIPLYLMLLAAFLMELMANLFNIKPLITRQLVKKFNCNWELTSNKAIESIEYKPISFEQAVSKTVTWVNSSKKHVLLP